jgi:hypothetical protein
LARIETRDEEHQQLPVGPPRGDEGLDEWFTRRLEAQGIDAGRRGFPLARVLSVIGLIAAVAALLWVLNGASGSGSDASSTNTTTQQQTTGSNTTNPGSTGDGGQNTGGGTPIPYGEVKLTVINGNGRSGAAGEAQSTLSAAGWNVVGTTNTDQGVTVSATEVVYPPGKEAPANAVAKQLGLGDPVPLAEATGVPTTLSTVALVLGPDELTGTTAATQ